MSELIPSVLSCWLQISADLFLWDFCTDWIKSLFFQCCMAFANHLRRNLFQNDYINFVIDFLVTWVVKLNPWRLGSRPVVKIQGIILNRKLRQSQALLSPFLLGYQIFKFFTMLQNCISNSPLHKLTLPHLLKARNVYVCSHSGQWALSV